MAYLKIYCDYCGQTWEVYQRSMNEEHSRECPHCGSKYGLRRKWRAHEGSSGLSCASVHF